MTGSEEPSVRFDDPMARGRHPPRRAGVLGVAFVPVVKCTDYGGIGVRHWMSNMSEMKCRSCNGAGRITLMKEWTH